MWKFYIISMLYQSAINFSWCWRKECIFIYLFLLSNCFSTGRMASFKLKKKSTVRSEKYCHAPSDVTVPIHSDVIEQQCETSSLTDYFTTSCFPPVLLHVCLPLSPGISTLCCCLSLVSPVKEHLMILMTKKTWKPGQCGAAGILNCVYVSVYGTRLFKDPFCSC